MNFRTCLFLLCTLVANSQAFASFPKNNLHMLDQTSLATNINEGQFNQMTDSILSIWQPLAQLHGAKLVAAKLWNDPTVNASALKTGNVWTVTMYGGMARRPEITLDAFAVVICHELGHLFGGYYFFPGDTMSVEGQADYFATEVCAKKVFSTFPQRNGLFRNGVPDPVRMRCNSVWQNSGQQDLCYRSVAAGISLGNLLAVIDGDPKPNIQTPDKSIVTQTFTDHPHAQCRVDTYFAGAVCNAPWDPKVIPGLNLPTGDDSKEAELASSKVSCTTAGGQTLGVRPLCWFKPQLTAQMLRRLP